MEKKAGLLSGGGIRGAGEKDEEQAR